MSKRAVEAFRKGVRYVRDVQGGRSPLVIYVSGSPDSNNLGDKTLFKAHQRLFHRCSFVRYGTGGRVMRLLTRAMGVSGHAMLAGGTLINRWGLGPAEECTGLFEKFFVFGTGVAQPAFWSTRPGWRDMISSWKPVLERADYLGVRGPLSAAALREAGLPRAEVIGDPVLAYAGPSPPHSGTYHARCLGLNLGESKGNVWGSEERIVEEAASLARRARENGWTVRWFVVHPGDKAATLRAASSSRTEGDVLELYDHHEYLESVMRVGVFVGMKLHAVVLATCAYVPSVMLEYRPKCRDYMMSIDHEELTVRTDRFHAVDVWSMVEELVAQREAFSKRLYDCITPVRIRLQTKAEEIMSQF